MSQELESIDANLAAQIDAVVNEFGSFGAAELELRSTILFVDREMSQGSSTTTLDNIVERVRQTKPHFSEATIRTRADEMKAKG